MHEWRLVEGAAVGYPAHSFILSLRPARPRRRPVSARVCLTTDSSWSATVRVHRGLPLFRTFTSITGCSLVADSQARQNLRI